MVELTSAQFKVMDFIFNHMDATGTPPTIREIASYFNWKSIGSAQDVIAALRKKGLLLSNVPGKSRQIVPTKEVSEYFYQYYSQSHLVPTKKNGSSSQTQNFMTNTDHVLPGFENSVRVPLIGRVAAGSPHEAIESSGDYISFPNIAKNKASKLFALEIEGLSMLHAGLLPKDIVLVELCSEAKDNDIVVAALGYSETTIKRFAKKGSFQYEKNISFLINSLEADLQLPNAILIPENPDYLPIPFGNHSDDKIIGVVRSLYRKNIF
ncbi:transcriptional repressor LexA [Pigmentibacter sp. JX0631]|uniref:transcriptional repressor LexA n=1 Tax=Pigmentibacter sp. JX0631 TaxID=2976982 RepID=UPI0024690844|nr:transcriptional repressor LexA [Pigmentibacter sp. JX0631]WGL59614.1 transcriptional repressor LexA [Pigmentibacter sp. JX0631]